MTGRPLHALLLPPSSADRLLGALAAALDGSGPAVLPLDPDLPQARLAALVAAFAPDAIETPAGVERLDAAGAPRQDGRAQGGVLAGGVRPETAVVIATSGSTGEPKGVELSAGALLHSARASLARIGAAEGGRWLCCLPPSHVAGVQVLVRSLLAGSAPVVTGRLDAGPITPGCDYVSLVPTQLRRLLEAGADLAAFRAILLGGAAAPAGLLAAARAAGARVITTYGMSETCGGCVYDGVPLDGVSLGIRPDGRIAVGGPVLFSRYRGRPDLTAAALNTGWFVTSDLGTVDAAGRLTIRGRADEMINTGGEKVSPAEVAAVLETCPGVREAAVFGQPDPEWGQLVTAVVVPADPGSPPDLGTLRAHVRERMPGYAAPRALVVVLSIPLLASGKPDLLALRRLA